MDSGQGNLALLILLVVAVLAFIKLRSVLGRRTGDEPARYERYRAAERAAAEARAQREASAPAKGGGSPQVQRDARSATGAGAAPAPPVDRVKQMTDIAAGNASLARGLIEVANADPVFDPAEFLRGGKAAYETIVTAFAAGDKAKLNGLLADDVLHGFSAAIDERASHGHHIDQSFIGIQSAYFTEAAIEGTSEVITVKFVSDLITSTRNGLGELVSGDPKKVRSVTDVWTFAKPVGAPNPSWRLVATRAASP